MEKPILKINFQPDQNMWYISYEDGQRLDVYGPFNSLTLAAPIWARFMKYEKMREEYEAKISPTNRNLR